MTANKITGLIFWFVVLAVALVAGGSFILSFQALHELAVQNGQPARFAWIWPLVVDTSVVIYTASILVAQLQRRSAKLAISLTIGYGIVTITGNILHAPPTATGWFVASLPPVSVILGTEILRVMLRHRINEAGMIASLHEIRAALSRKSDELDSLNRQIEQARERLEALKARHTEEMTAKMTKMREARDSQIEARRQEVLSLVREDMSHSEMADRLDVSESTIARDIKALRECGQLNGRVS